MNSRLFGRIAFASIGVVLIVTLYFEVYKHFWVWELIGAEPNAKVNLLVLSALGVLAVVHRASHRRPSPSWLRTGAGGRFAGALVLFACASMLSLAINEPGLDEVARYLFYLLTPILVLASVIVLHPTNDAIRRTLAILFLAGLTCAVYSTALHLRLWSGEDLTELYRLSNPDPDYVARDAVPGVATNSFPSMLVPMVLTGFYFAQCSAGWQKMAAVGATGFLFFNLLITGSKGAVVSFLAGVVFLAARRWFHLNARSVLMVVVVLGIFTAYGGFVRSRFERSIVVQEAEEGIDGYERLASMSDSVAFYFAQHPLLGAGFTYFNDSQGARIANTDHNVYTQLLAAGGLLVMVPFSSILFLLYRGAIRMLRKCRRDPSAQDLGTILAAGLVAFVVDLNFPPGLFHYYAVWWGLVAAWNRNTHMQQRVPPSRHRSQIMDRALASFALRPAAMAAGAAFEKPMHG